MELLEKNKNLEDMMKEGRNSKVEKGREKVTAESDLTRMVVSGCRTSEKEADILSADVNDRRVTLDATIAGSECTRKAEVSTKNEAERQYSSVDEEVSPNQESKGTWAFTSVGEWKESLSEIRAPPQKRRAVIRVESAATQGDVSKPQGFEEIDDEEMR